MSKAIYEVFLTELETEVLSVFVKHQIIESEKIIGTLSQVIDKLEISRSGN